MTLLPAGVRREPAWYSDKAVFITGCDSGLGFSLATACHEAGLVVVAACHSHHSTLGSQHLQTIGALTGRLVVITHFDVTDPECVVSAGARVAEVLSQTRTRLWAVVNNAAVLVLANFEWQTSHLIERQIKVLSSSCSTGEDSSTLCDSG